MAFVLGPGRRQDVLLELLDGDLVVVDLLALAVEDTRARHGRRDDQRLLVLGDGRRVEGASRHGMRWLRRTRDGRTRGKQDSEDGE